MQRRQVALRYVTPAAGVALSTPKVTPDSTMNVALLGAAIAGAVSIVYRGAFFLPDEARVTGPIGLNVFVGRRMTIGGAT